jgi:hypothetical protein
VLDAYGVKPGAAGSFARQCLMARRLSEAGVRFVEICQPGWDHHNNLHKGLIALRRGRSAHRRAARRSRTARPAGRNAGAVRQRVRPPADAQGRTAATTTSPATRCGWPAPASNRASRYGQTDEYGLHAVEGRMHTTDLHATLLALMGLDHEKLTYRYAGRDFRLTDVAGNVVRPDPRRDRTVRGLVALRPIRCNASAACADCSRKARHPRVPPRVTW